MCHVLVGPYRTLKTATAPWNTCAGTALFIPCNNFVILPRSVLLHNPFLLSLVTTVQKIWRILPKLSKLVPMTSCVLFGFSNMSHKWLVTAMDSSLSLVNGSLGSHWLSRTAREEGNLSACTSQSLPSADTALSLAPPEEEEEEEERKNYCWNQKSTPRAR